MAAFESHAAKNDAWGRNLAEALSPEIPVLRPALSGGFQNAAIGNRNRGVNQTADVYRDGVTGLQNTAASKSVSDERGVNWFYLALTDHWKAARQWLACGRA